MNKVFVSIRLWAAASMAVLALGNPVGACAQEKARTDSIAAAIRLDQLKKRRSDLQERIRAEDEKRNRVIEGASAASLERMNLSQDSVCLELRSELVGVQLEIDELSPNAVSERILHQYNRLRPVRAPRPVTTLPSSQQAGKEEREGCGNSRTTGYEH